MTTKPVSELWDRYEALQRIRKNYKERELLESFIEIFNLLLDEYSHIEKEGKLHCFYNVLNNYLMALEQSESAQLYNERSQP